LPLAGLVFGDIQFIQRGRKNDRPRSCTVIPTSAEEVMALTRVSALGADQATHIRRQGTATVFRAFG
jgi:hypothetical protein